MRPPAVWVQESYLCLSHKSELLEQLCAVSSSAPPSPRPASLGAWHFNALQWISITRIRLGMKEQINEGHFGVEVTLPGLDVDPMCPMPSLCLLLRSSLVWVSYDLQSFLLGTCNFRKCQRCFPICDSVKRIWSFRFSPRQVWKCLDWTKAGGHKEKGNKYEKNGKKGKYWRMGGDREVKPLNKHKNRLGCMDEFYSFTGMLWGAQHVAAGS